MILTLLLPWFPIILGVGVGGRLLGRTRGYGLGLLCALFWMVLVGASAGTGVWGDPWTAAAILAGSVAIIAMGGWAGESPISTRAAGFGPRECSRGLKPAAQIVSPVEDTSTLQRLTTAMEQFDEWLEDHRNDRNPWPGFDEFIRAVMNQCCGAKHVKPYRLAGEGEELLPLREPEPFTEVKPIFARRGMMGHVVTTGRSYYAGDATQGELVAKLADDSSEPIAWCFAIRQGTRRLGVVVARQLDIPPERSKQLLRVVERLVTGFWCTLAEACHSRAAALDDPVSGLLTREAFLRTAEQSLSGSYQQGEPVALAVIALEKLRELNDSGRWEVADELVAEVSNALRQKVRMDDRLGRFDGSRLLLLLRRVDSQLATLIVGQVMSRLTALCGDRDRWNASIEVRCGVVGSGTEEPDLRSLISRALIECHRARAEGVPIASDLPEPSGVGCVSEATCLRSC